MENFEGKISSINPADAFSLPPAPSGTSSPPVYNPSNPMIPYQIYPPVYAAPIISENSDNMPYIVLPPQLSSEPAPFSNTPLVAFSASNPQSRPTFIGSMQPVATVKLIRFIKISRILIPIRIGLMLIYMLPLPYLLPLIIFEILAILGFRLMQASLLSLYLAYLYVSLGLRTFGIVYISFLLGTSNAGNNSLLIVILSAFCVLFIQELYQIIGMCKFMPAIRRLSIEAKEEIFTSIRLRRWKMC